MRAEHKIEPAAREALSVDFGRVELRLNHDLLDELIGGYPAWAKRLHFEHSVTTPELNHRLITYLRQRLELSKQQIHELSTRGGDFRHQIAEATTKEDQQRLILTFSRYLGASPRQLRSDRRALQRDLDGAAMMDRCDRLIARYERLICLCLERMGTLIFHQLLSQTSRERGLWRLWRFDKSCAGFLQDGQSIPIALAALRALDKALAGLPAEQRETNFDDITRTHVLRMALDLRLDVWLQCAAWRLLGTLSPRLLDTSMRKRGHLLHHDDDIFVRYRLVKLCAQLAGDLPDLALHLQAASRDPSPFVRQAVAHYSHRMPPQMVVALLESLLQDEESCVRAAALSALPGLASHAELDPQLIQWFESALKVEQPSLLIRYALHALCSLAAKLDQIEHERGAALRAATRNAVESLCCAPACARVQGWAARSRLQLRASASPDQRQLIKDLEHLLPQLSKRSYVAIRQDPDLPEEELAEALATLADNGFGFDVVLTRREIRIYRQHQLTWRLWRFLHELRHPATDKRQAHSHTVGRIMRGRLQIPSPIMAELSETQVPGEPLYIAHDDHWRPFVPLPDSVISACGWSAKPVRIVSAWGVTEVHPPRQLHRRLLTRAKLIWQFARLSQLRNWRPEHSQHAADAYISRLQALGVNIRFREHLPSRTDKPSNASLLFPATLAILPPGLLADFGDYFVSIYENSLRDLLVFLLAMTTLFIGRHLWNNYAMRRIRRRIPLVIGGWGTRGKSGTERLKAALFNALGYNVVSKTTGCEAMFVHGHANGEMRELFLFRPYDKATIWEQVDVMRIADTLGCEVFLWECMGLTPAYVKTLQQQWMRDDIATITNTYPDHEDLQGPAGIDIPKVMTEFIPHNSTLITSEEQMHPVLQDAAARRGSDTHCVGWHEAGLIPPDILQRFPYEEHPYNMALVVRMAQHLGVPRDYALKEMADRVIADLGVLKAYPWVSLNGRRLQYVMGNSANERLGAMGNWQRMGFADFDPAETPATWTCTLVNNRADRIARSRVFANMLVKDLSADRHVLIGSNLDGLLSYMRDAWRENMNTVSLVHTERSPQQVLEHWARRLRIPYSQDMLDARLDALSAAPQHASASAAFAQRYREEFQQYQALSQKIGHAPQPASLDASLHTQLWNWFESHLLVIHDEHASAHRIIHALCEMTPPGYDNRIMGMQNIKGTGLDFVYAWQAWEQCHGALSDALSLALSEDRQTPQASALRQQFDGYLPRLRRPGDDSLQQRGIAKLAGFAEYNSLCRETFTECCDYLLQTPSIQTRAAQAGLQQARSEMHKQLEGLATEDDHNQPDNRVLDVLLRFVESFLDAGDAVKRRRRANRIYRDLGRGQISVANAAAQLQKLTKRQKGGWLQRDIKALR